MSRRERTKRVGPQAPTRRPTQPAKAAARPAARREGEPLDPDVRSDMESRFGRDFGHVRVHTDADAGASALALGASAYTVGRDIVFSPGAYQPSSGGGKQLLAHELAHVGPDASTQTPSRIDSAHSAGEQAASASADAALAGRAVQSDTSAASEPGVVHRSLLGAGIGGVIGGVGLGLIGGLLLGPVGAVLGAVVGLVGGAIIGDLASRRERSLKKEERDYAWDIYHDAVDYDAIRITRGAALSTGAARTLGNSINLQDEHFVGDTMDLSPAGMLVLIHEMGHVWQYQNGGLAYIPSSLIPQIVAAARGQSRNVAYDWRNAARNHIDWADWNAEQQAECISDYNEALRRINAGSGTPRDFQTVTLAEPYIELVRRRIGAPGSSRRQPDTVNASGAPPAQGSTP
jgi:Domain of unknown function (DUF4157)